MAGVDNVVHLQVDGRVHDRHDQTLLQRETRSVHELQQDGKALRVHLRVQTDGVEAALVGVGEDGVEQPTVTTKERETQRSVSFSLVRERRQIKRLGRTDGNTHLQAMRTVLCARNGCRFTRMVTSVRMSRLRSRFRLSRTSLA